MKTRAFIFFAIAILVSGLTGLFAFQTRLIYFPDDRDLADCTLPSPTHLLTIGTERALFTPAKGDHLVVFFHGNAGSACNWRFLGANHLAKLGYDTLVVEYPGYGGDDRSPSKATIEATLPTFNAWVETQDYDSVTIFGYSLGSAVGSLYAQAYDADQIILFAPFDSLYNVAVEMGYKVPRAMLTEDYDNMIALSAVDAPIYILHGDDDRVIPVHHSETLALALSDTGRDVTREIYQGKGHDGLFDSPEFDLRIQSLLIHAGDTE